MHLCLQHGINRSFFLPSNLQLFMHLPSFTDKTIVKWAQHALYDPSGIGVTELFTYYATVLDSFLIKVGGGERE